MRKKVLVGKIYPSKCGNFLVLNKTQRKDKTGRPYFYIRFIDTNYEYEVVSAQIYEGNVLDPFKPSVFGTGYLGNAKRKGNERLYDHWKAMIARCYYTNDVGYHRYGGSGIYVDKRWHCFENFIIDAPYLPGWNPNEVLVLDKDKSGFKYYSKDTCCWVTKKENTLMSNQHMFKNFIATSPSGNQYERYNITEFAKQHSLTPQRVSECLRGIHPATKGWTFKYK